MDLKAEKKSLKALLAVDEQQFRIPPYQRPYAWSAQQVDDLWEDLIDNVDSGHFLGSVVLSMEEESRPQVIDGQQRLTTLMILLAVLRERFHFLNLSRQVQRIGAKLTADEFAEGDAYFKFKTGSANWPVFRDVILLGPDDNRRKSPQDFDKQTQLRNKTLLENYTRLRGHLAAYLQGLSEAEQEAKLDRFHRFIMERVELVVIEVKSLGDAFLLFETLNDRGMQLSAADLLKSHLLGEIARRTSDEDVDASAAEWDSMLDDLGPRIDVSRFLRHYLLTRYPKVQKDEVFGYFKELIGASSAQGVLQDLRLAAAHYGDFEAPERVTHEPTRQVLVDLQTLRAVTCYIALLPARRNLSERDFLEFARLTEVLTFRYSSVVGLGTNDLERRYHEAAKLLAESRGSRLAEARAVLLAAIPGREQFLVAFDRLAIGRQYLLRYALRKLEESLNTGREFEMKTADLVHIEHIMPQKLSAAWREELGAEAELHGDYVNRWGNLTLLYSGLNVPASNKPFNAKKPYYDSSQVQLTRMLSDEDRWGPREIEARQRWLGETAEKLWVVDDQEGEDSLYDARAAFRTHLGDLADAVMPLCVETSSQEMQQLASMMPAHLVHHPANHEKAAELKSALQRLLSSWESYDVSERSVARAAVDYFLMPNDVISDESEHGLADDELVIEAASQALKRAPLGS